MKLPLSWIQELIPNTLSPEEISDRLTMAGLEVEEVKAQELPFTGVVVGKVIECGPHPEAEKLKLTKVTDGNDEFQVICGASNCRKGITIAFARPGARLTDAEGKVSKIKKTKLRGVDSYGMICSERELGLSDEHEGILEMEEGLTLGQDLHELFGDVLFDIALTPNLNHCASAIGVVRELSALTGSSWNRPKYSVTEGTESIDGLTSVTVDAAEACPRYACRLIQGVKIGPSPQWLVKRLEGCGVRSVNNVVDATNLVLMESGHPLHGFDYDRLAENRITVRFADQGETFQTLDDETRTLTKEDLLICDGEKAVALAGIMGGLNSEISDGTTNVLLESAYFQPTTIRRTSKRLGLSTEASKRFERGADPQQVLPSLDRATALIQDLAGGTIAKGVIDQKTSDFPKRTIHCRHARVNKILGTQLAIGEMEQIFHSLEFGTKWDGKEAWKVTVPTYRGDLSIETDLIEEVARIYGYDNIPRERARYTSSPLPHAPIYLFEKEVRQRLNAEGLQEFLTCDLIGPSQLALLSEQAFPRDRVISVQNPTSLEQSILRPSLLPGILQVIKHNADQRMFDICGFEVGRIHFKNDEGFKEQTMASVVMTGQKLPISWSTNEEEVDFFDLKGRITNLIEGLGIQDANYAPSALQSLHPGRQAAITIGDLTVGAMGEVHPATLRKMGIGRRVYFAELNLHDLFSLCKNGVKMSPLPQFPGSERDWTLTVKEELPVGEVLSKLRSLSSKLLKQTTLTSVYRSEKLGTDRKNITFRLVYRHDKKTLPQSAVDGEHARIIENILSGLGENVLNLETAAQTK